MENENIIINFFKKDKKYPAKVIEIKSFNSYDEQCYYVILEDANGKYSHTVCVKNGNVIIAPK